MDCSVVKELIVQYSSGDLGQDRMAVVESHISRCQECGLYFKQSEKLWTLLDVHGEIEPEADFVSNFWDRVSQDEIKSQSGLLNWLKNVKLNWTMAGAMASILILCVFTFTLFQPGTDRNSILADDQDELLLLELDNAISRDTAQLLDIYGPWENGNDMLNGDGGTN